jgi:hypothetical protein
MLLFFIPSLFCRIYEFYKQKKLNIVCFAQETFITFLFLLSPFPKLLWLPISFGLYIRWYGLYKYQADIFTFLRSPKCFLDSIQACSIKKPICTGLFASFLSYSFFPNESLPHLYAILAISAFFSFYRSRRSRSLRTLTFPNELSTPVSYHYPALRKTHAFLGHKQIQLSLEKPNIIFIFLESFRAKNVGCLGAKIAASPHFDRWAKQGILFRNFHANGLQTFRAFISAYFGIPGHLRSASLKPFCSLSLYGLPQILKKNGYHPALIQSGDVSFDYLYPFFKKHGFETIIGGEEIDGRRTSSWGIDDEDMVRFAASWLEKQKEPTFLSLCTITNHHPWKLPGGEWRKDPYENFLKTFEYTDACLHLFLERINLKNTIVFIAGDHGQEMGERRPYSEMNHSLYEENIHLPFLILGDKVKPQFIDSNASFVDFLPTVLDLLNLKETHHSMGRSLLRAVSSPTFFSMHREELQIGALLEKKKVILPKGYDLEKDPDETSDIGPLLQDLSLKCKQFFLDVDAITQSNAWAPTETQFSLEPISHMDERKWIEHANKHSEIPVINLSDSHFGDRAITNLNIAHVHQISLRNCTRITDVSLNWLAKKSQKLMSLDLSHCQLLTDDGVRQILLPSIRHLWLDGLDIEDFVPEHIQLNLRTCSLKSISRLSAKSLKTIYTNSPNLIFWSAHLQNISSEDLLEISQYKRPCTNMSLECGIHIGDEALSKLLESQKDLQEVHLENFPLIEEPDFTKLTKLRYLTFLNCPKLSKDFIQSVKELPLIRVSFFE